MGVKTERIGDMRRGGSILYPPFLPHPMLLNSTKDLILKLFLVVLIDYFGLSQVYLKYLLKLGAGNIDIVVTFSLCLIPLSFPKLMRSKLG
jgi:hypothetical protein